MCVRCVPMVLNYDCTYKSATRGSLGVVFWIYTPQFACCNLDKLLWWQRGVERNFLSSVKIYCITTLASTALIPSLLHLPNFQQWPQPVWERAGKFQGERKRCKLSVGVTHPCAAVKNGTSCLCRTHSENCHCHQNKQFIKLFWQQFSEDFQANEQGSSEGSLTLLTPTPFSPQAVGFLLGPQSLIPQKGVLNQDFHPPSKPQVEPTTTNTHLPWGPSADRIPRIALGWQGCLWFDTEL